MRSFLMFCLLLNPMIINQMRSQLLQQEEEGYEQYKSVRVQVIGEIFAGNARADEPIFKKKDLIYDKHELSKIISFEQLELLMRPFKNDPAYRKCRFWIVAYIVFVILLLASIFATIPMKEYEVEDDQLLFIIWAVVICSAMFGFIYSSFRILFVIGAAKKAFKGYCENLDLTLEHLTITAVTQPAISNLRKWVQSQKEAPGKYSLFCEELSYFQIKSTRVLNDETTVKLYNRGSAFSGLNVKMESPIFQAQKFEFNKAHLQRIIPFADLQAMLRPFKNNDSFKKYILYLKRSKFPLLLLVFLFVPLFFDLDQLLLVIIMYGYGGFVYAIVIFILCKSRKPKQQMFLDFVEFCKEVSRGQSRVEIIAHLNESDHRSGKQNELFCIEVKIPEN